MDQLSTLQTELAARYALDREVGAGGMATVFLARDLRHDRSVALKVLKPELGAVLGVERFLAEIKVTAQLQHPNILPLFDSGEASGLLYYVMPYVDGETLRARLQREKQLPVETALAIARAIASALDYAHAHNVIHRDLKPENILFQAGEPVLADFGIALAVANAGGTRITQTGLSLGTPQYMSPEQATGDRVIDGRTDIYSLGAVLYEMLAGEPPHTGTTAQAIIARLLTDKVRSVRSSRDAVPVHVEAAIERSLAKLPADRFATAKEFATALGGAGFGTTGMTSGAVPSDRIQVAFAIPKVALLKAVKYAAVAGAVAVGAWGWLRRTESPPTPRVRFTLETGDSLAPNAVLGQQSLQISPDGTELVYPGTDRSGTVMFRRRLADLTVTRVAGSEGFLNPRYSPDSRWLMVETAGGVLTKIPLGGGPSVRIADSAQRPTWGTNDVVVFARGITLWRASSGGGSAAQLTKLDSAAGDASHLWPFMLPGGKHVLFNIAKAVGGPDEFVVAVASISDGTIKRLPFRGSNPRYVASGHLLVSRQDGNVLAIPFDLDALTVRGDAVPVLEGVMVKSGGAAMFSVSETGTLVYLAGDAGGRPAIVDKLGRGTVLGLPAAAFSHPRLSPNGDRVVVQRTENGRADIWVFNRVTGQFIRLTRDGASATPEWSADGARVVWLFVDSAGTTLRWARADGAGAPTTLATPSRSILHFTMAPNGKFLAAADGPAGLRDITLIPLDSTQPTRKLAKSPVSDIEPSISPDSRWLAFQTPETGRGEVYVSSIENPETRLQVSTEGAGEPQWMSDGKTLVYRSGTHFIAAHLSLGTSIEVTRVDTLFVNTFIGAGSGGQAYDIRGPKDEMLVLARGDRERDRITVVVGWLDELKERMAAARRN